MSTPRVSRASIPDDSSGAEGFAPQYFPLLFSIEDRHFWFRSRNRVIDATLRRLTRNPGGRRRVLEVGCGTGNVLRVIERACPNALVVGMDLFGEALPYARRRSACPLVQGDMHRSPFAADAAFDIIGAFDVLEHLHDDLGALAALRGMLKPGGVLIVTVPAYRSLWSYFDEAAHHCRRYDPGDLMDTLVSSGYSVEYLTPYMVVLFPLMWAGRRAASIVARARRRSPIDAHDLARREFRVVPGANALVEALLALERPVIRRRQRLPFGGSLLAVARAT